MLTERDLRELLKFSTVEPVLSLYLNTDPNQISADEYKLRLRNMLKEVNLPQDTAAIERYFQTEYHGEGRGVAVFSCFAQGFFRAFPLQVPVRNQVGVSDRPNVKPLANLLDNYGGYGVVLVDKQGARVFSFHLGELREQEGHMGETVKHTKRGGASTVPGRRGGIAGRTNYMEEVVNHNMKEIAAFAAHFFEENHVRRILIGGTDDNIALFRGSLSKAWQSLVMGTFAMSMTASHSEVLKHAMHIGIEAEHAREVKLVESLIDSAAKGGTTVTGVAPTLSAINAGKVQTLLFSEGLRLTGYLCPKCKTLSLKEEKCVQCGEKPKAIPDVVELAVSTVMKSGGVVEVVAETPTIQKLGGMGAIVRY
jgi:peptide chain release factor subunit 1